MKGSSLSEKSGASGYRKDETLPAKIWQQSLRWITTGRIFLLMMVLQLAWLAAIWVAGAANKPIKLLHMAIYTFVFGVTAVFMERVGWATTLERRVNWSQRQSMLVLAAILLLGGAYYTTNQRMWNFDEEGNYAAAELVAEEGPAALFSDYEERGWLGKQHPPLGPLAYGAVLRVFGTELAIARALSLAFMIGTGWLTYLIGRTLYDGRTGLLAAWVLFTFPLFFRQGTAAVVEIPLTFFFALTVYLTLTAGKRPSLWRIVTIGVAIALGLLFKYTMVFVLPVVASYLFLQVGWRQTLRYLLGLLGIGGLLLMGWLLFAAQSDVLQRQVSTIWTYLTMVTTNPYGRKLLFETVTTRLPTAFGVYNLPILGLSAVAILMVRRREDWPVLLWIGLVWLPLLLTLPEHRYFLMTFPAVALLMGRGIQRLPVNDIKVLALAVVYCIGSLYLFVDWFRVSWLFIK